MDEDAVIREVDRAQAEAVLCIRLSVPGVTEGGEDRYYLARTSPWQSRVLESVTHNPDGSVTTISTYTSETSVAYCDYASGRTANGRGFWSGKHVSIVGRSSDDVVVQLSMHWTARDGSRGNLDEELVVRWLTTARVELSGGGWVAVEITPVGGEGQPSAAADLMGE